jgi:predicted nucleotidyltransferase
MERDSVPVRLKVDRIALGTFCERHHIRRLALFGSVLRDDFDPSSDVDVLVEFEPDCVPGLIRFGAIERELGRLFDGRRADLVTFKGLNRYIRDGVLASAEPIYARG